MIKEFGLYVKRLPLMPIQVIECRIATWRISNDGFPFHLALLQLEHDSSFQMHSHFDTMTNFLELVIRDFAKGAPQHHHLVFKAHPLEDGRVPMRKSLKEMAARFGVSDRVHYVRGAKLARLLNDARTAITMNSTAGQQVLWRGIPLKIFGSAVYSKPEFISYQPLVQFFKAAERPNKRAYKDYRR
jgi:capsular polysaccharide export protein